MKSTQYQGALLGNKQNHSEIPLYISQDGYNQKGEAKEQVLIRM